MAGKILVALLSVAYPCLVFCGLYFWNISPRFLSLILVVLGAFHFVTYTQNKDEKKQNRTQSIVFFSFLLLILVGVWITNSPYILKLYPVVLSVVMLLAFSYTLHHAPTMVFRFATLQDKSVLKGPANYYVEKYCRKVTVVWCVFLIFNALVALATVVIASDLAWSLYNGFISYVLMGLLFAGELLFRKKNKVKQNEFCALSRQSKNFRDPDHIVSFLGRWEKKEFRTWRNFVNDVGTIRQLIQSKSYTKWLLHSDDSYWFLVSFVAILQCKKELLITANIQPSFIAEIQDSETGILTDQDFNSAFSIPEALVANDAMDEEWPAMDPDMSKIALYTSGSTGIPKRVAKTLRQFENEVAELQHLWGKDYVGKAFCSTVSHHHIYGLLFSVLEPFSMGAPFRRDRIDFPEELAGLSAQPYVIVASPAFMKRLVGSKIPNNLFSVIPVVLSSGGVLPVEAAEKTFQITGFWPQEIYGSTETGGIAYRQSRDGLEWTPFAGCTMTIAPSGCLNVKSNYIIEADGFTTGDLVEFLPSGQFLLKGRADSIVKIEEKRISLPEVEMRLMASGYIQDACAVALSKKRQFLAVACVFNDAGKKHFEGVSKFEINTYFRKYLSDFLESTVLPKKWRYVDELPVNTQGKLTRKDVEKLFESSELRYDLVSVEERDGEQLNIQVRFPTSSIYFDGHFPQFKLLPAVVQVDLVLHWCHKYLGSSLKLIKIPRVKFSRPLCPNSMIHLEASYNAEMSKISFKFQDLDKNQTCSSGNIFVEKV